jgi:anti-anti-sigma factor
LDITQELLGDTAVLRIRGDLDRLSAPALATAFRAHLRAGNSHLLLDLTSCPYVDSGGPATIMATAADLGEEGMLAIVAPSLSVQRLLEIVGLFEHRRTRVFRTEKEALSAIGGSAQRTEA